MSLEIVDEIFHINNENICGYVFGIIEHNKSFKRSFWLFQKLSGQKYGKHCIAVYCGGGQFTLMTYLPDHPVPLAVRTKWLKTWAKRAEKQNKPRNKRMFSQYRTVAPPRLPWKKQTFWKSSIVPFLSVPPIGMQFNIAYCFNGEYPEKTPRTSWENPESTLLKIGWRRMDVIVHYSSKNTFLVVIGKIINIIEFLHMQSKACVLAY